MICTMGFILDCALIVMLSCFMPFHVRMVLLNETTIDGPSPEFHVGWHRNWRQVMGKDETTPLGRLLWFLPLWGGGPDGDGVHWPSPLVTWAVDDGAYSEEGAPPSSNGSGEAGALEEGRLLAGRARASEYSSEGE